MYVHTKSVFFVCVFGVCVCLCVFMCVCVCLCVCVCVCVFMCVYQGSLPALESWIGSGEIS